MAKLKYFDPTTNQFEPLAVEATGGTPPAFIDVGDTAPLNPGPGQVWFDTTVLEGGELLNEDWWQGILQDPPWTEPGTGAGVTRIIAGDGVNLQPSGGTGNVTLSVDPATIVWPDPPPWPVNGGTSEWTGGPVTGAAYFQNIADFTQATVSFAPQSPWGRLSVGFSTTGLDQTLILGDRVESPAWFRAGQAYATNVDDSFVNPNGGRRDGVPNIQYLIDHYQPLGAGPDGGPYTPPAIVDIVQPTDPEEGTLWFDTNETSTTMAQMQDWVANDWWVETFPIVQSFVTGITDHLLTVTDAQSMFEPIGSTPGTGELTLGQVQSWINTEWWPPTTAVVTNLPRQITAAITFQNAPTITIAGTTGTAAARVSQLPDISNRVVRDGGTPDAGRGLVYSGSGIIGANMVGFSWEQSRLVYSINGGGNRAIIATDETAAPIGLWNDFSEHWNNRWLAWMNQAVWDLGPIGAQHPTVIAMWARNGLRVSPLNVGWWQPFMDGQTPIPVTGGDFWVRQIVPFEPNANSPQGGCYMVCTNGRTYFFNAVGRQ